MRGVFTAKRSEEKEEEKSRGGEVVNLAQRHPNSLGVQPIPDTVECRSATGGVGSREIAVHRADFETWLYDLDT